MSAKINFYGNMYDVVSLVSQKLSVTQRELFEETCFGHLMDMKPMILSAQIIHQLVARQADVDVGQDDLDDQIFFDFVGNLTCFSKLDFALITGLKCHGDPTPAKWKTSKGFIDRVFNAKKGLTYSELDTLFKTSFKVDSDEDVVRVALLYLLTHGLMTHQKNHKIPDFYLQLVDDLETFNNYPWGAIVFDETKRSLHN